VGRRTTDICRCLLICLESRILIPYGTPPGSDANSENSAVNDRVKPVRLASFRPFSSIEGRKLVNRRTLKSYLHQSPQSYWLSGEVASGEDIATIFSEVLGRPIRCEIKQPNEFMEAMSALGDYQIEPWYAAGTLEFLRQVSDGRMGYIGTVRNDAPYLAGKCSITLRQWAEENRSRLQAVA
jgi:hypothetical protein